MKPLQYLRSSPKSNAQRFGLLITLILVMTLVFGGFYLLTKHLVSGTGSVLGFSSTVTQGENSETEQTQAIHEMVLEAPTVPEGMLTPWDGNGRVTVLVMGLDYRDWSAGEGPSRTDTMMLLTLDPLKNTAGMLSIPRDLWVSIPGFENGRINTAYFLGESYQVPGGGPGLAIKTVEGLLGVEINYYAQVDFGAFTHFIDELGGVKIDVPKKIKIDPIVGDPVKLKPELQVLNGELALAYARARNTQGGDLDRAQRQQQVIFGIRERLLDPGNLSLLISKAPILYAEIAAGVETNMSLEALIKLAVLAQKVSEEAITREAISPQEVIFAESPDGQSVLVPLPEKIRQLRDEVFLESTGTLGPLLPGTSQERMVTEGAKIKLLNSSQVDGLAKRTQAILQATGANIIEISNGEFSEKTRIVDYTGNPHTAQFLAESFEVQPGNYSLAYDPESPVDVVLILGLDWSTKEAQAPQVPVPVEPAFSGESITFQDDTHGFALDYPAGWSQMVLQTGERGSITTLASWQISPENLDTTPPGGSRIDVSVLQWEPLDLNAYVFQRKTVWDASGITVLSEENQMLQSGLHVVKFKIAGSDGQEADFLFALIGERYITISGSGDFETMRLVGESLRTISITANQ